MNFLPKIAAQPHHAKRGHKLIHFEEVFETKNDHQNKSAFLKLRLSPNEMEQITQMAELLGVSRSEYVRRQTLTGNIGKPVIKFSYASDALYKTSAELNKIGNNLNQISRHLNANNPSQLTALNRIEKMIDILTEETEQIEALLA